MKSVDFALAKGTAIVPVEWVKSWPDVPVQVGQAVILGQELECGSEFARWCVELVGTCRLSLSIDAWQSCPRAHTIMVDMLHARVHTACHHAHDYCRYASRI